MIVMSNSYQFLDLPVELLHTTFIYLWGQDIFYSFFGISPYLDSVIQSYHRFHLNLKSIRKSQFDLIWHHIRPEQIITLILSDDIDTPCQSQLFLSIFNIERDFAHLRSFILVRPGLKWTRTAVETHKTLMRHSAFKLYHVSLQQRYVSHGSTNVSNLFRVPIGNNSALYDNDASLYNRRYLKISIGNHPFERIKEILQLSTKLTQLNVRLSSIPNGNLTHFEQHHQYLTRFTLRVKHSEYKWYFN
jgi:hypothetical protein